MQARRVAIRAVAIAVAAAAAGGTPSRAAEPRPSLACGAAAFARADARAARLHESLSLIDGWLAPPDAADSAAAAATRHRVEATGVPCTACEEGAVDRDRLADDIEAWRSVARSYRQDAHRDALADQRDAVLEILATRADELRANEERLQRGEDGGDPAKAELPESLTLAVGGDRGARLWPTPIERRGPRTSCGAAGGSSTR